MEHNNKEKTERTKQQQTHRTQEWTNSYQRERDWEGWVEGRDKGENGALRFAHIMESAGDTGKAVYTEKTSNDSIASYYTDGQ